MRKSIVAAIGVIMVVVLSQAALAQGPGGGNTSSGEGTSSGQAGRSGDRPGK